MAVFNVPFLCNRTDEGLDGRPFRPGWVTVPVEIGEAAEGEFSLAVCETFSGYGSRSTYAGRDAFWMSTMLPNLPEIFNAEGVLGEVPFDNDSWTAIWWSRILGETAIMELMKPRIEATGRKMPGMSKATAIKTAYRIEDISSRDIDYYASWSRENLVAVEGRLLKKVHAPSLYIKGRSLDGPLGNACELCRETEGSGEIGSGAHHGGIHFEWPGEGFDETWAEGVRALGSPAFDLDDLWESRQIQARLKDEISRSEHGHTFTVAGKTSFCPSAIASVDGRQDMAERTVLGIAGMLGRTTMPHAHRPGLKRDVLMALKEAFETVPSHRGPDFAEKAVELLGELPTDGEAARKWFVDKALACWDDRTITVSPIQIAPRSF